MFRDIYTELLYSHTGYDMTNYFRSEVIATNFENAACDGFGWNFSGTV